MSFKQHQSESRQRRYPLLSIFDATLNVMLCGGILALGCAFLGVIVGNTAPHLTAQISQAAAQIWR